MSSHTMAGGHGATPFCEKSYQMWVVALAVGTVIVLALAFYHAYENGQVKAHHQFSDGHQLLGGTSQVAGPPAGPQAVGPLRQQAVARPSAAMPVASVPMLAAAQGFAGSPMQPVAMQSAVVPAAEPPVVRVASPTGLGTAQRLQSTFNQIAESSRPFVVNISAISPTLRGNTGAPAAAKFVNPFDGVPDRMVGTIALESIGSGVIIDPSGYVVTNDHLVNGATTIMISRFGVVEPVAATLITTDPTRDLALLKIDGNGPFPAAQLANSDNVQVGDWVLAVGNPFGFGHTVTAGIVSSRRSSISISGVQYRDLLQTDVPINRGSSGGPLVNLQGKVIGINTAIYAPTGVFNGTGFAIPANRVASFVTLTMSNAGVQVNEQRRVLANPEAAPVATWLGVQGTTVDPALALRLGLPQTDGVFVNAVEANSPAMDAEIRGGDVLTQMAGQRVRNAADLQAIVTALPPGQNVPITIWRANGVTTRTVKLGVGTPAPQPRAGQRLRIGGGN